MKFLPTAPVSEEGLRAGMRRNKHARHRYRVPVKYLGNGVVAAREL